MVASTNLDPVALGSIPVCRYRGKVGKKKVTLLYVCTLFSKGLKWVPGRWAGHVKE